MTARKALAGVLLLGVVAALVREPSWETLAASSCVALAFYVVLEEFLPRGRKTGGLAELDRAPLAEKPKGKGKRQKKG